ncbi:helix-turn-helix transcriptional regulator [Nostoc sp. NIES-2111]
MMAKPKLTPTPAPKKRRQSRGGAPVVDEHVGKRVRLRRVELGMSQQVLARLIGITFQQLQKNERGVNRLSASRMYEAARVLDVPIGYFFDGIMDAKPLAKRDKKIEYSLPIEDEQAKRETLELVTAYYDIRDRKLRQQMVGTMRALARSDKKSPIHDRPKRGRPLKKT